MLGSISGQAWYPRSIAPHFIRYSIPIAAAAIGIFALLVGDSSTAGLAGLVASGAALAAIGIVPTQIIPEHLVFHLSRHIVVSRRGLKRVKGHNPLRWTTLLQAEARRLHGHDPEQIGEVVTIGTENNALTLTSRRVGLEIRWTFDNDPDLITRARNLYVELTHREAADPEQHVTLLVRDLGQEFDPQEATRAIQALQDLAYESNGRRFPKLTGERITIGEEPNRLELISRPCPDNLQWTFERTPELIKRAIALAREHMTPATTVPLSRHRLIAYMKGGSQDTLIEALIESLERQADEAAHGRPKKSGVFVILGKKRGPDAPPPLRLTSEKTGKGVRWILATDRATLANAIVHSKVDGVTLRPLKPLPKLGRGEVAISSEGFDLRDIPASSLDIIRKGLEEALALLPEETKTIDIEVNGKKAQVFKRDNRGKTVWAFRWHQREVVSQHYGFVLPAEPDEETINVALFTDQLEIRPWRAAYFVHRMVNAFLGGRPEARPLRRELGSREAPLTVVVRASKGGPVWVVKKKAAARLTALPRDLRSDEVAISAFGFIARGLPYGMLERFFDEMGEVPGEENVLPLEIDGQTFTLTARRDGPIPMWALTWEDRELFSRRFGILLPPADDEVPLATNAAIPLPGGGTLDKKVIAWARERLGPAGPLPQSSGLGWGSAFVPLRVRDIVNNRTVWFVKRYHALTLAIAYAADAAVEDGSLLRYLGRYYVKVGGRLPEEFNLRPIDQLQTERARSEDVKSISPAAGLKFLTAIWRLFPSTNFPLPAKLREAQDATLPSLIKAVAQVLPLDARRQALAAGVDFPPVDLQARATNAFAGLVRERLEAAEVSQAVARFVGLRLEAYARLVLRVSNLRLALFLSEDIRDDDGHSRPSIHLVVLRGSRTIRTDLLDRLLRLPALAFIFVLGALTHVEVHNTLILEPSGKLFSPHLDLEEWAVLFRPLVYGDGSTLESARARVLAQIVASDDPEGAWSTIQRILQAAYPGKVLPSLAEMKRIYKIKDAMGAPSLLRAA